MLRVELDGPRLLAPGARLVQYVAEDRSSGPLELSAAGLRRRRLTIVAARLELREGPLSRLLAGRLVGLERPGVRGRRLRVIDCALRRSAALLVAEAENGERVTLRRALTLDAAGCGLAARLVGGFSIDGGPGEATAWCQALARAAGPWVRPADDGLWIDVLALALAPWLVGAGWKLPARERLTLTVASDERGLGLSWRDPASSMRGERATAKPVSPRRGGSLASTEVFVAATGEGAARSAAQRSSQPGEVVSPKGGAAMPSPSRRVDAEGVASAGLSLASTDAAAIVALAADPALDRPTRVALLRHVLDGTRPERIAAALAEVTATHPWLSDETCRKALARARVRGCVRDPARAAVTLDRLHAQAVSLAERRALAVARALSGLARAADVEAARAALEPWMGAHADVSASARAELLGALARAVAADPSATSAELDRALAAYDDVEPAPRRRASLRCAVLGQRRAAGGEVVEALIDLLAAVDDADAVTLAGRLHGDLLEETARTAAPGSPARAAALAARLRQLLERRPRDLEEEAAIREALRSARGERVTAAALRDEIVLLAHGLRARDRARALLETARRRFPDDPALSMLARELDLPGATARIAR